MLSNVSKNTILNQYTKSAEGQNVLQQKTAEKVAEEQKAYLRGKRYENEKLKITNKSGSNQFTKEAGDQDDPQPTTSEKLAEEYHVSKK